MTKTNYTILAIFNNIKMLLQILNDIFQMCLSPATNPAYKALLSTTITF